MGKYPNPVHYAAARFANVNTDHARRQAAQRGEGARFERKVGSADVDHTARQLESIVSSDQFDIAEHLDNKSLVKDVLSVLSEVQQRAVILVFVEGYSVTEAAKILGKRRETVSRILRDAKIKANKTFGPAA
jgi:RNA polymerase sigma factor (sigma-70 family)